MPPPGKPHKLKNLTKRQEQYLVALQEAAARRERARAAYEESMVAVSELIVGATEQGLGGTVVGRAAGLTRQRVDQILQAAKASA